MDNMKTIAITLDEESLDLLEYLSTGPYPSRSALVRAAIKKFAELERRRREEEREQEILHRNRDLIARQARALVQEQAQP